MANLGASMYLRDLNGDEYMMEGEVKHSQEINGDERIDVEIEYTDVNAHFLRKNSDLKMWILGFEAKEYRIISSTIKGHGNKYTVSVTGILYMLDWLNSNRIYQRIDASLTTVEAMNLIFDDSPFTYQITAQAPSKRFEGLGDGETRLEMLKKFIEGYGFEITILGNVMYFQALIGNDTNFQYEYKVNATDITQETDASEMFTYAEGYGDYPDDDESAVSKAKLKRSYVSPLESIVGHRRHAPPIKDGRITIKETMDAALKKLVDDSLQISFSANLNDLKHRGYKYEHAKLGDRIFLVDKRIGLDTEIRVVKIDRSYSQEYELKDISITFGSKNMADTYTSNFSSAVSNINDVMAGRKAIPFEALGIITQSMVSKIQNTSSELTFDINGIHAIDKNDANNIVTLNSSGMYLSTDGGRTGKTAITAEGITANAITAGSLLTTLVNVIGRDNLIAITGDEIRLLGRTNDSATHLRPDGMRIKRPDGAWSIIDGVPEMSLSIQRNVFMHPSVTFDGQNYIGSSQYFLFYENFYVNHDARYLVVSFGANLGSSSSYESAYVKCRVREFGSENNQVGETRIFATKSDTTTFDTLTIDLGTPTYQPRQFYLEFAFEDSDAANNNVAKVRTNRVFMKG